jgi:hypothetical protein
VQQRYSMHSYQTTYLALLSKLAAPISPQRD